MIGTAEIVFIAIVAAGSIVYILAMHKAGKSSRNAPPPPPNFEPTEKAEKKIKEVKAIQDELAETVRKLTNKMQDLEVAMKLKPEKKEEKKKNAKPN
jgi:type IV secretory pathway VirB10-like protein